MYEKEAKDAPFVAYIPEFDVSSCGRTEAKARKNVKEALEIVLEEVKQRNKFTK
jgi:predicted RNase H-like HicB family nuclease